jgi:ABC-type Zn2+ transport system substrate-binding protein/surface adhesin
MRLFQIIIPSANIVYLKMPYSILLLLFTIVPINLKASETANVITTIKPLHSLVSAVMEGTGRPLLLLQGASSLHDYQLKPSQLTKVLNAKIIFYIDEKMKFFLRRTLNSLPKNAVKASITKNANIKLLDSRGSGIWAKKIKNLMLETKSMTTRKKNTTTSNMTLMFGYRL